jgi:hypothetical protein
MALQCCTHSASADTCIEPMQAIGISSACMILTGITPLGFLIATDRVTNVTVREMTEPRMLLDYITTILKSPTHPLGKNINGFVDQFTYVCAQTLCPTAVADPHSMFYLCPVCSTLWSRLTCEPSRRPLLRDGIFTELYPLLALTHTRKSRSLG